MSDEVFPIPEGDDDWPSPESVLLPSRAMFRAWRDQTLPTRTFALDDAIAHFDARGADDETQCDMAVLGVIGEAMQALEDLAYLGTAWDRPFQDLPNYVRAITFGVHVPTNFWQEAPKWDDERLLVLTGHRARHPETKAIVHALDDVFVASEQFSDAQAAAITEASDATARRVRKDLVSLARDWRQFAPYFHAYKHGGLAISREDVAYVDDDFSEVSADTPRHHPSIAVWTRGRRKQPLEADFSLSREQLVKHIAGAGRAAIRMTDAFIESRLAISEAVVFDNSGNVTGLRELRIPWTHWLASDDLTDAQWEILGPGPKLTWARDEPK